MRNSGRTPSHFIDLSLLVSFIFVLLHNGRNRVQRVVGAGRLLIIDCKTLLKK